MEIDKYSDALLIMYVLITKNTDMDVTTVAVMGDPAYLKRAK